MSSNAFSLSSVLAVVVGAALGALLRWRASVWLNPLASDLPLGTLAVNCVGGLLAGACWVWFSRAPNEAMRLFCVTGLLGGLTTFSTFSAESLWLVERGRFDLAAAHTLAHVLGALGCAALGARLMRFWLG